MNILESNDLVEMFYYYNRILDSDEFINNQVTIVNKMLRLATNEDHLRMIFLLSSYIKQNKPKQIHIII
jgi:hypothetical protein